MIYWYISVLSHIIIIMMLKCKKFHLGYGTLLIDHVIATMLILILLSYCILMILKGHSGNHI